MPEQLQRARTFWDELGYKLNIIKRGFRTWKKAALRIECDKASLWRWHNRRRYPKARQLDRIDKAYFLACELIEQRSRRKDKPVVPAITLESFGLTI